MSRKRTLAVRLPLALGVASASTLVLCLGGVFSCSRYPTYKDVSANEACTADDGYEFYIDDPNDPNNLILDNFLEGWYPSPDYTPDGGVDAASGAYTRPIASAQQPQAETIPDVPDGGLCGRFATAGVFRASHNNDWGGLFGTWKFGQTAEDASQWDGIAFWGRAPGGTTPGFTLAFDDDNTTPSADSSSPLCRSYTPDGGVSTQAGGSPSGIDPATGTPLSGSGTTRAPYPDECGNSYAVVKEVTSAWRFYTVPFGEFQQDFKPNRVPNSALHAGDVPGTGLLRNRLRYFRIRMTREAEMELWLAHLAFYKKPTLDAGARADAAQPDRAQIDGPQVDRAQLDGAQTDGAQIDGTQIDEAQVDGVQVDGAQIDAAQMDLP